MTRIHLQVYLCGAWFFLDMYVPDVVKQALSQEPEEVKSMNLKGWTELQ